MQFVHNSIGDYEHTFSSVTAMFEVYTGISKTFTTTLPNQLVYIDVQIPFTVHRAASGPSNAALRLYLDGTAQDAGGGKQWNGWLVGHGSGWQTVAGTPATGMPVSVHQWIVIPEPGEHTLRLQCGTSTTDTIATLRSRQYWQVSTLCEQAAAPASLPPGARLDVTESAEAAAISSITPNVELQREVKTFTASESTTVYISVSIPAKYCKVGGANATGRFRLYLDDVLLAEQAGPLITSNGTLPAGPWVDGAALEYAGSHAVSAGSHTLSLRYVGDTTLVCGIAKASRSYRVEIE